jgi:hypothetical protein
MKKIIVLLAASMLFICTGTYSQNASKDATIKADKPVKTNGPVAKFDKTEYQFSDLQQNSPGTVKFVLTNDGNEPLVIESATASCGCTTPQYSKDPILPGKSSDISVTYNAAVLGSFMKTVTIRSNAGNEPIMLKISGKVVPKS